jgi:hypothetical protein
VKAAEATVFMNKGAEIKKNYDSVINKLMGI